MPTLPVLDDNGQPQGNIEVSAEVFGGPVNTPVLHQSVVRELADQRAGTHATRGRSEVSGGGRKPWRQKGTGRARQGSIRATQWKGGGKPFGPSPRSYDKDMPRQMRRLALRSAFAAKLADGAVTVVDRLALADAKTKALTARLRGLGIDAEPTLVMVAEAHPALMFAARNVPWLEVETPTHASAYQVVRSARIVIERAAMVTLEEALAR
jgi:large subunit ribosomal protein L4